MYRHLLLPTDGSELSVRAFTAGIALAKTLGARVTGLSVVPEHQVAEGLGEVMVGRENAIRAAEEFVAAIAAEARRQGVPHECFYVRSASVSDGIVKTATERSCDHVELCEQKLREWSPEEIDPVPLITGDDLTALGLAPGPIYKRLLDAVRERHGNDPFQWLPVLLREVQDRRFRTSRRAA